MKQNNNKVQIAKAISQKNKGDSLLLRLKEK